MAWTRSMTRNQNHDDDEESSNRKRPKTCAPWSDLNHDLLLLVMMRLGFGDYYSFRGVCKSWKLLAHSNKNKFIESRPPMSITISTDSNMNVSCSLKDFEGRKFKNTLPRFSNGGVCIEFTCGYLIFFNWTIHDFWLVNPITRKQIHFPHFPNDCQRYSVKKAILVSSPSISGLVFFVLCRGEIWLSIEGKGVWKHVSHNFYIIDLYAFKGKLYTLSYNGNYFVHECRLLCELRLNPEPKFTLLQTMNPLSSEFHHPLVFVTSGENLFVIWRDQDFLYCLRELDVGILKWVKPCEKTMEEYAFFRSYLNDLAVAITRESWADPRSRSLGRFALSPETDNNGRIRFFIKKMWYFPHLCMNVDQIND